MQEKATEINGMNTCERQCEPQGVTGTEHRKGNSRSTSGAVSGSTGAGSLHRWPFRSTNESSCQYSSLWQCTTTFWIQSGILWELPILGDSGPRRRTAKKNLLLYKAGSNPSVKQYICTVASLGLSCGGAETVESKSVLNSDWLWYLAQTKFGELWRWSMTLVRVNSWSQSYLRSWPVLMTSLAFPSFLTPAHSHLPMGKMVMVTDHHLIFFYLTHKRITFWCPFFLGRFHFAYLCGSDVWSIRRNAISQILKR